MTRLVPALTLAALAAPAQALACGGFFCNVDQPIDQAGEQIVFAVNGTDVTMHVQVTFSGQSDDFAWIVPVSGEPDLFVSSDALFTALEQTTRPQFYLQYESTEGCNNWSWGVDNALEDVDADASDGGGVTVVAEQQVGPYDTVVLQATDSAELLEWLNNEGYDLPADLDPVLQPYVADNQYFVALKLSAGNDVGDLTPLALKYQATQPSIPIQLTSIAATPNMRLTAYVLGDTRAVPDNYLHVKINDAAIDWFNNGSNYNDVITLAADEAGGHAFATDFAGSTTRFHGMLWSEGAMSTEGLAEISDPVQYVDTLMGRGFQGSAAMLAWFLEYVPMPQAAVEAGIEPRDYYNCLGCYTQYGTPAFDPVAATAALEADIIEPLRLADELFRSHAHISRMTSSLDAIEMDVDPMFTFNPDLPQEVTNVHYATVVMDCGLTTNWENADRTLVLEDGREIDLPSQAWLERHGMTELDYMGDLASPAAIVIEDYGSSGLGEVLFDWTQNSAQAFREFGGCAGGCNAGGGSAGILASLAALGMALVGRRRR